MRGALKKGAPFAQASDIAIDEFGLRRGHNLLDSTNLNTTKTGSLPRE
jgi:hypothetical protein